MSAEIMHLNQEESFGDNPGTINAYLASQIALKVSDIKQISDNFEKELQVANSKISGLKENIESLSSYIDFIEVEDEKIKITEFGSIFNKTFSSTIHKIIESAKYSMEMIYSMQEVARSIEEVESFITKIQRITYMANMLAMNAAIEANKAGEAGKGFNIVANEVKEVSSEISTITTSMGTAVKKIARSLNKANAVLEKVAVIDLSEEIFSKDRIDLMLEAFVARNLKLKTEISQIFGHKYEGQIILDKFLPIKRSLEGELAQIEDLSGAACIVAKGEDIEKVKDSIKNRANRDSLLRFLVSNEVVKGNQLEEENGKSESQDAIQS